MSQRNLHTTQAQETAAAAKLLPLPEKRNLARLLRGTKPRHIRKLLALSGRQYRKAMRTSGTHEGLYE